MRLLWIESSCFRNLSGARLQFGDPVTLFFGENGQGKTNILEAVHTLGLGRSFRERRLGSLVREGEGAAGLRGGVKCGGVEHDVEVRFGAGRREVLRDGVPSPMAEYASLLPVVSLSAEDRVLVRGEPKARREFLDGMAVVGRPAHLGVYQRFRRALRQRNELLRGYTPSRRSELDAWTETYAGLAREVRRRREEAASKLVELLSLLEAEMDRPEQVELRYAAQEGDLTELLRGAQREEIRRGHTLHGPHRDGVEIYLGGRPAASFGSSGQVRTALWMLKLARLLLVRERDATPPVFLLDDAQAELDAGRVREMMRMTEGRAQILLTATEPLSDGWGSMKRYRVRAGEVSPGPTEI